jgi:threonylcarbamoyladenosine tRNA methylthiotransferase MtaB
VGQEFDRPGRLRDLLEGLLQGGGMRRLRLSSLEPWDLDEEFFHLWADPRLCRHLHLPIQSGSQETLRRMARKTTPESFYSLVKAARAVSPDIAITTDIIAGFPGESDAEFTESLDFVRQMDFAAGHVFTYSARPGTAAARMANQVPVELRRQRNAALRAVIAETSLRYRQRFIHTELDVLWEATAAFGPDGWRLHGLTANSLRVTVTSPQKLWNEISRVRTSHLDADGFIGSIV